MALSHEIRTEILERYANLKDSELTDKQKFAVIGENLDVGTSSVRRIVKGLDSRDNPLPVVPETSADYEMTEQEAISAMENVKGTSTLYDADGNVRLRWVKAVRETRFNPEEWIAAFAEDIPKAEPVKKGRFHAEDLLAVYPMGDPHLGMLAHAEEAGEDFDIKIAERHLVNAVDRLVRTAPPCRQALIVNLGDFFHADNTNNETLRSRHKLDTDSRWSKVFVTGIRTMKRCITSALEHHEYVRVFNLPGNHDDHTSIALAAALAEHYSNEPRVEIPIPHSVVQYHHFGNNLFGFYHGHDIKPQDLPLLMAREQAAAWGDSTHRYWYCGHIHHDSKKEYQGVMVETFRTLAARDAWSASRGYWSGRDMKCIVHHRTKGWLERHRVSVEMLEEYEREDA